MLEFHDVANDSQFRGDLTFHAPKSLQRADTRTELADLESAVGAALTTERNQNRASKPPNIADEFEDLFRSLDKRQRRGIVARLSVGFYEGWHPSRGEVADLVAVILGTLSVDECIERHRKRNRGEWVGMPRLEGDQKQLYKFSRATRMLSTQTDSQTSTQCLETATERQPATTNLDQPGSSTDGRSEQTRSGDG